MHNWSAIITRGFESKDLDYKAPTSWDASIKESCCKLVKDILALANANGGYLVIGVNEPQKGNFVLEGLTEVQAASFETTRVNQFLQNYCDPPINATVVRAKHDDKIFIIVQVPAFPDTPHICQKDFPGVLAASTIYVRTDNNESAPLKSSSDFRAIVEAAVRKRADSLLTSFRAILTTGVGASAKDEDLFQAQIAEAARAFNAENPYKAKGYTFRESIFYPVHFQQDRFDLGSLRKMAHNAVVSFRGWPHLFIDNARPDVTHTIADGLQTQIVGPNPFIGSDSLHFWQLRQSGMIFLCECLQSVAYAKLKSKKAFLDFDEFIPDIAEAIFCLVKLYEGQLDDSDEVSLVYTLRGVKDLPMGTSNPDRYLRNSLATSCKIEEVSYAKTRTLADWKAGLVDHAIEVCAHVFDRFNVRDNPLAAARDLIQKTLKRAL